VPSYRFSSALCLLASFARETERQRDREQRDREEESKRDRDPTVISSKLDIQHSNMNNYIERNNFLNRLNALQRLCSDYDPNYPSALLFVPGQDGRGNKGSITVLKYLLRGSVGKELFDETLEQVY
jgi:hypothetical protein